VKYLSAPVRFIGQKRRWLDVFNGVNLNGRVVVDVFGGSGLLSHTIKQASPCARVIWNDYDNVAARLERLPATEVARQKIVRTLMFRGYNLPEHTRLSDEVVEIIRGVLAQCSGYDEESVIGWFTHSLARAEARGEFKYYNLPKTPLRTGEGYLEGVERVQMDFAELIAQYAGDENAVFVCDPPYIFTEQATYKKNLNGFHSSFGLRETFRMLELIGNAPSYVFTSLKSEMDFIMERLGIQHEKEERRFLLAKGVITGEELYYINGAKRPFRYRSDLLEAMEAGDGADDEADGADGVEADMEVGADMDAGDEGVDAADVGELEGALEGVDDFELPCNTSDNFRDCVFCS
jgi:site-specific DNA-adenine methylase